ncbi:MAG: hypothetical protein R3A10_11890 [Caldilineaceae bacterium]
MAHYNGAHPAAVLVRSGQSLAWVMGLSWEEFNALTTRRRRQIPGPLYPANWPRRDPEAPLLVSWQPGAPGRARAGDAARAWCVSRSTTPCATVGSMRPRAEMRGWLAALPHPAEMWAKFLRHDRLMKADHGHRSTRRSPGWSEVSTNPSP